jgi:hypothetical protein
MGSNEQHKANNWKKRMENLPPLSYVAGFWLLYKTPLFSVALHKVKKCIIPLKISQNAG